MRGQTRQTGENVTWVRWQFIKNFDWLSLTSFSPSSSWLMINKIDDYSVIPSSFNQFSNNINHNCNTNNYLKKQARATQKKNDNYNVSHNLTTGLYGREPLFAEIGNTRHSMFCLVKCWRPYRPFTACCLWNFDSFLETA